MTVTETDVRVRRAAGKAPFSSKLCTLVLLLTAAVLVGCAQSPDQVELVMPELSNIADGVYRGTASVLPVIARVEVTVTVGRIAGFRILRHLTGQGQAAEALAEQVVDKQTIKLDAVTGATYSSKAILKAGEKALRRGLKPEERESP